MHHQYHQHLRQPDLGWKLQGSCQHIHLLRQHQYHLMDHWERYHKHPQFRHYHYRPGLGWKLWDSYQMYPQHRQHLNRGH